MVKYVDVSSGDYHKRSTGRIVSDETSTDNLKVILVSVLFVLLLTACEPASQWWAAHHSQHSLNRLYSSYRYVNCCFVSVRRVPPSFSIPPPPQHEVMLGQDLNLTCVAVGSPMPYVKWRRGPATDLTPEDKLPIGRNVLELTGIQESANYTCVAASALGVIEATTHVKVQCTETVVGLKI
ncbi:hypothetical protein J6590_013180 [Homalodisca vitripennis]|nr:hypothetical protein J6590_013180 [Homalodisca vitripennis]